MSNSTNSTESKTDSKTNSGYTDDQTKTTDGNQIPTSTDGGENLDEFGYKIKKDDKPSTEQEGDKKPEDAKPEDKKDDNVEPEKKVTGYGEQKDNTKPEDNKDDKTTEEDDKKPEDEKAAAEKLKAEISETVKDLPEGYDKEKVTEFALKNGFSNDQVKAYVEMEKAANADYINAQQEAVKEQRKNWVNELKNDTTFGGENFDRNVNRVEKLIEKYMPNLQKNLTDSGNMLPPYIMRDFLALDKVMNPTSPLVNGEPPVPKTEDDGNFLDDLYE